jgi:hypothetical protein
MAAPTTRARHSLWHTIAVYLVVYHTGIGIIAYGIFAYLFTYLLLAKPQCRTKGCLAVQPPYDPSSPPTTPTSPTWQQQQMPTLPGVPGGQQKTGLWQRYRGASRTVQVLIAAGAALTLLVCSCCSCGVFVSALNGGKSTAASTATSGSGQTAQQGSTGVATASRVAPTATPEPTSTAQPTATPKPVAKPTCILGAVNCNPWGYNFTHGHLIYSPNPDICSYISCIQSFWNGTGYVIECHDGNFSKSGGHTGSCSRHNGDWRPLYAP